MGKTIRIFVTTSHISTVYITLHASATKSEGYYDVLFIDDGKRKEQIIHLIDEISQLHNWDLYYNFSSILPSNYDFKPSWKRNFIRRWKSTPGISFVYGIMLQRFIRKKNNRFKTRLISLLQSFFPVDKVELYLMTQTYLNLPLREYFPQAEINFMEHGIGDYFYIQKEDSTNIKFVALFSNAFSEYLSKRLKRNILPTKIHGLNNFNSLAKKIITIHNQTEKYSFPIDPSKPIVLIILEAVDMYNVNTNFWTDYLVHIVERLDNASKYHYLVKPHPIQSEVSLKKTTDWFNEKKLNYNILDGDFLSCISIEIIFQHWLHQTEHVFCLFSSSCFYLSQLYKDSKIKFWYSTTFMSKYIENAPPQYQQHFNGLIPLIEEVFSENCTAY